MLSVVMSSLFDVVVHAVDLALGGTWTELDLRW